MAVTLDDILTSHRTRRPIVMGVLNVTPDSFSDGGEFFDSGQAIQQARVMLDEGADIIDIGPESTRPGSDRVSAADQIDRIRNILPAVAEMGAVVSIDTTWAEVARFALAAGAAVINDVSAGRDDPSLLALAGVDAYSSHCSAPAPFTCVELPKDAIVALSLATIAWFHPASCTIAPYSRADVVQKTAVVLHADATERGGDAGLGVVALVSLAVPVTPAKPSAATAAAARAHQSGHCHTGGLQEDTAAAPASSTAVAVC